MILGAGLSQYDTVFPGALLRITFQKAHWWHTNDMFLAESQRVYNALGPVAHLAPAQTFPLAPGGTEWTVDARTQIERSVADIAQRLRDACDFNGVDLVEVASLEVLTPEKIRTSNKATGAAERNVASATANPTSARNPGEAIGKAIDDTKEATKNLLGGLGKVLIIALVLIVVFIFLIERRK